MSKYTTEVRFICEHYAGLDKSEGYNTVNDTISHAIPHIFDFNYPIFDDNYKSILEAKIMKHYYTREIGEETVGLWKLRLDTRLNEIMPYYNKLYETTLYEFNPIYSKNITRDYEKSGEGFQEESVDTNLSNTRTDNLTTTNNSTDNFKSLYSDTPQGSVSNLENNTYLTNATINSDTYSGTSKNTGTQENSGHSSTGSNKDFNNLESYIEHIYGYETPPIKLVEEFRNNILNIDLMIINDLSDLFMNIW